MNLGFKNIFNHNLLLSYKVITPYEIRDVKFQEDMYTTDITIKTVSFKRVALEVHESMKFVLSLNILKHGNLYCKKMKEMLCQTNVICKS